MTYLTLKNYFFTPKMTCFNLIEKDKFKWTRVTLIEVYLGAANRSSHKINRFLIKIQQLSIR